ncbi:rhodanese-like domain-containing protein [Thiothrix litoralis]|jgi:rhodanese-related sulfurtransferase|uniref:Rhodanese-like domain-containing protein n=2 Tax=Thiothrix TaxID=1030 RepID=A0ABY9MKV3_9GAMM|nr:MULTISPECIES: rhodanese-like domain-containing protein [Thiothrix]QTR45157.1 rhodanese-like domain-containing protein [Thiothrix litoralis]WML89192.1 rhodanese-like domain-containing protein [Thiothrix lacustris]WMP19208.1 rhodanese-like domain-containing protein [Thiothrix lacustris]
MFGIREVDAAGLQKMLDSGEKVRLIDVRSASEVAQGIIENSEFMPLHTLPLRMNDLPKDETIVFYCRSGARSAQACMFLSQNTGIEAVNLRGGIISWYQAGMKVVLPNAA